MSLGPLMFDLEGTHLTSEERELLHHPLMGGVVLFSRNYQSVEQLTELVADIHSLRTPRLLVAVDHEGGRVQRFRDGFTRLPSAACIGSLYDHNKGYARKLAQAAGWVMAGELRAVGIDFSFAPVVDLDYGISEVIGDRAFHRAPRKVADLAFAYIAGMRRAGMSATAKHFPGHGHVASDTHLELAVDERSYDDILDHDILPYRQLITNGLAAIMPAHVVYSHVDNKPAGFSPFWLGKVLRQQLGFQGVIFSDDINMEGAGIEGDYLYRAESAFKAGCDMVLICNNRTAVHTLLSSLQLAPDPVVLSRLVRMHGIHPLDWSTLHKDPDWHAAVTMLRKIESDPGMDLPL